MIIFNSEDRGNTFLTGIKETLAASVTTPSVKVLENTRLIIFIRNIHIFRIIADLMKEINVL